MSQPFIQASFNSGEWAPHLWARTDVEKYHSGAALLRNFFVDYRGGASTRTGTKYCLRGYKDSTAIRMITFQASIEVGYALEFGDQYIRFYREGQPVLETATSITAATAGPPEVFTDSAHGYSNNDWLFIANSYYIVQNATTNTFTLTDLFGNAINTNPFTLPVNAQRIYTIASPYAAADLALLKFVQNVDVLILCHPSYTARSLTFTSATSWALDEITYGATISAPSNLKLTPHGITVGGGEFYSYVVTATDSNGQESIPSTPAALNNFDDIRTSNNRSITLSWDPVSGAQSYNCYRAVISAGVVVPTGAQYGYIGNVANTSLTDSNIAADFTISPPVAKYPFATGSKVASATIGTAGSYSVVPTVTFSAPSSGVTATGTVLLGAISNSAASGGSSYVVGDTINLGYGITLTVVTVSGGAVVTATITAAGSSSTIPANPLAQVATSGSGTGATFNITWGVVGIAITNGGWGYVSAPTITFSSGSATATANLSDASNGNPAVPAFFQQRLCLAAPPRAPNDLEFSQPGNYYNFDVSNPIQADDAISAQIVSSSLANIKSLIPQPGGLIVLCDGCSYLINGGSLGAAISPSSIVSNAQSFLGANDMPPIVVNFDILYVQSKGCSVRDSTYNFYANIFTGTDISVISSHLFFGYQLLEWAWAEEPYKVVWVVRNDGTLLSLTFIKEQDFIAWSHSDTGEGSDSFKSVCSVVEPASVGFQNFVYAVVKREINSQTVQYIEYFPERATTGLAKDYWTVDCGLQYSGSPATSFSGAEFLAGRTCTGLADGVVITPFTMPADGKFTLPIPASKVTVGLGFTCELQTLYLDLKGAQSTVQTKEKKINGVGIRVTEALGLWAGTDETNAVPMKDLVVGNVGRMTNELVTDLVTGDAFTYIDPKWQEPGQIYIRQPNPLPASILGYIPQVAIGDTGR